MKSFNDIDRLKSEWNKLSNSNLKNFRTMEEIEKISKQKSKNEIHKIKRKFIIESVISIIILIAAFVYVHKWDTHHEALLFDIVIGITIVTLLLLLIPIIKLGKIHNRPIKEYLQDTVSTFKKVYNNFKLAGTIAFPIGFICGVATGILHKTGEEFYAKAHTILASESKLAILTISFIVVSISGYFFVKYYYQLLYKKHIDQLENMLHELNNLEQEDNE